METENENKFDYKKYISIAVTIVLIVGFTAYNKYSQRAAEHSNKADEFYLQNDLTSAEAEYWRVVETASSDADKALALRNIAFMRDASDNEEGAIEALEQARQYLEEGTYEYIENETDIASFKEQSEEAAKGYIQLAEMADDPTEKADNYYYAAMEYEDLEDTDKVVEFYRLSGSYYPETSGERYDAYAQAEWELENSAGIKEYLEKGYEVAPTDIYLLDTYGHFLNGISLSSYEYQDLEKALKVNTEALELSLDDESLETLAFTYLLMGDEDKFNELISQMNSFWTPDDHSWVAKIYHRIGNVEKAEYHKQIAVEGGEWQDTDEEFYSLVFSD